MTNIYLATDHGVAAAARDVDWRITHISMEDKPATSIIAREGVVLTGTKDGIYRSDDEGRTWREASKGLDIRHIRWLAYHPEISDFELAGTEPAGIFISRDGANSWQGRPEVAELRDEHHWFLPYSPKAGCVRGFALHGSRVYAAVEVGGALVSEDNASTWRLAEGSTGNPNMEEFPDTFIHPDVHSILVHPSSENLVFAPTGGGFYRSKNGGKTWELLYDCYCRSVWVDPADADHMILGPADGVDRNGRIEETHDGGKTWIKVHSNLSAPWHHYMVERFTQVGTDLLAVLSNGQVISTALDNFDWHRILPDLPGVNAITGAG